MKRLFLIIALALALVLPSSLWAAGTCTQTPSDTTGGFFEVTFVCTASADDGSIPTQTFDAATMTAIQGKYYLYWVMTMPTAGGTAPDAADIQVLMNGQDILGGKGVNLIHATATQDTLPYSTFMSLYRYAPVRSTLTWTVANQSTNSANFTVIFTFDR